MNERKLKLIAGIVTVVALIYIVRPFQSCGPVFESLRPAAEGGKLGNPVVAIGFSWLLEALIIIGGYMIVMATGLWKWIGAGIQTLTDDLSTNQPAAQQASQEGVTGEEFVALVLQNKPALPPEVKSQLEQATLICAEKGDYKNLVRCAEKLSGVPYPRQSKTPAKTEAKGE